MHLRFTTILLLLLALCFSLAAQNTDDGISSRSFERPACQSFDQTALASLLDNQRGPIDSVDVDVKFDYYVNNSPNNIEARLFLKRKARGKQNLPLIDFLTRDICTNRLFVGDTLIIPDKKDVDMRAYSPFPWYYPESASLGKVVVLDKTLQVFGAYEDGDLVRWGAINTGGPGKETPAGRFNFNYRVEHRVSSLSPPGDPWDMHWVMNFHEARGMHLHQYYLPTGAASSHGCVRMIEADAMYLYDWIDTWKRSGKRIIEQGTTLLIIGEESSADPRIFDYTPDGPLLKLIELPKDPMSLPPGTPQQERFDKLRSVGPVQAVPPEIINREDPRGLR